jgi:2-haloacid dehalogenase
MAGFTAASAFASSQSVLAAQGQKAEAVLFDAFPIFDPSPVFTLAEELFPGKGAELSDLWRNRQFEYTWLRALSRHYEDFWQVTEESLVFAAGTLRLDLTAERRERLMNAYLALKPGRTFRPRSSRSPALVFAWGSYRTSPPTCWMLASRVLASKDNSNMSSAPTRSRPTNPMLVPIRWASTLCA